MQNTNAIVRQPILIGLLLSVAIHAAILHGRGNYAPAIPKLEMGKTVVQLTLLPSLPSPAQTAEPRTKSTAEKQKQLQPPVPLVEQVAQPDPQPVSQPKEKAAVESTMPNAIEQDATLETQKGITSEASIAGSFKPSYPRISRRRGEEGTVTLSIHVFADGSAGNVGIIRSSGHRRLDEAAVKAARQSAFSPALKHGRSVESTTQLSYTFRLTDD